MSDCNYHYGAHQQTIRDAEFWFGKYVYELMYTPKWMWLRRMHLRRMERVWYKALDHIVNVEDQS